jgi:CheY-like chemotaxis protein
VHLTFDVDHAPAMSATALARAEPWIGPRLDGIRVLVVDDVPANLEVARLLLEAEGAVCTTARHGQEALERLQEAPNEVDVVLLDLQMPEIDGLGVAQCMRANAALAGVPVIALTAGALPSQREQALAAGMNDFITKPFELDAVVGTILHWTTPSRTPMNIVPATASASRARDAAFPAIAGIDQQKAQRRFMGDSALFLRLLNGLREEFSDVVQVVRAEVQRGELTQAAMRVHKLCGLAGSVSADAVAGTAAQLENALRSQRPAAPDALLEALDHALRTVIEAIPERIKAVPDASCDAPQDAAEQQTLAHDLAALLAAAQAGDTSALDHFEALRGVLTRRHGTDAVARLDQALYGFRFVEASAVLQGFILSGDGAPAGGRIPSMEA